MKAASLQFEGQQPKTYERERKKKSLEVLTQKFHIYLIKPGHDLRGKKFALLK